MYFIYCNLYNVIVTTYEGEITMIPGWRGGMSSLSENAWPRVMGSGF